MATIGGLRLLSLPNEVLAIICADNVLSAHGLAAMRLTNQQLHAVATQEFAQRYFRDPFVMMSKDSLETLVEICKHPVFGPQVRKVQLLNIFSRLGSLVDFAQQVVSTTDIPTRLSRLEHLQRLTSLVAEQYDLLKSDTGSELLRNAFEIIGAQRRDVAIASQKFEPSYPPIGWRNIAEDFRDDQIGGVLGEPEVLSTIEILLQAAKAGACKVSKLEVRENGFSSYLGGRNGQHDIDGSLLLGLQEFNFHFQWRERSGYNFLAHQHLKFLLRRLPNDLKSLALSSDAVMLETNLETHLISYHLFEGLRHTVLHAIQFRALANIHLGKMVFYQNDLQHFLSAHRGSLKRLILDGVYLHGEWDQVLFRIAETFSLEHFKLSKARTVVGNPRTPRLPPSVRFVSRYSKDCELKSKDQVCQDLNMFIELQKVEALAKEAKKREPPRLEKPHRSARIAKNKTSEN
jgi:hypothetical protein